MTAARKRFRRDGYAGTALDAIVADCGLTKGAFYHHFSGKEDLFEAVFIAEHEDLFATIIEAYTKKQSAAPKDAAFAGFRAFIRGTLDPGVQRIILIDAPSVLGWEKMREIEGRYALAVMREGIRQNVASGQMGRRDPETLAHILRGALTDAALYIAQADDQRAATRKVERELKLLLETGLFA